MAKVLLVLTGFILLVLSVGATAALEIDGISLDVSEKKFIEMRPTAKLLSTSGAFKDYLYILPNKVIFEGAAAVTSARGFKSGEGCAGGLGFELFNSSEVANLVNRIKSKYRLIQETELLGHGSKKYYLENEVYYISITEFKANEKKLLSVTFSVTLKACGEDLARRWQILAR